MSKDKIGQKYNRKGDLKKTGELFEKIAANIPSKRVHNPNSRNLPTELELEPEDLERTIFGSNVKVRQALKDILGNALQEGEITGTVEVNGYQITWNEENSTYTVIDLNSLENEGRRSKKKKK